MHGLATAQRLGILLQPVVFFSPIAQPQRTVFDNAGAHIAAHMHLWSAGGLPLSFVDIALGIDLHSWYLLKLRCMRHIGYERPAGF